MPRRPTPLVYISGALTGLPKNKNQEYKHIYESAGQICKDLGFNIYLPHTHNDPYDYPLVTAPEVWSTNIENVEKSSFVIAFTDHLSFGVGSELGVAAQHHIPVVVVYRLGKPISKMVLGNPSIIGVVTYSAKWLDGSEKLRQMLLNKADQLNIPRHKVELHKSIDTVLVEFKLPITYNDGQLVPESEFLKLEDLLQRRFGGWSVRSGRGGWASEDGTKYVEDHRHYDVEVKNFSRYEFYELKQTLKNNFKQIELDMRVIHIQRL
jgi:hypothetical protein